MKIRFNITYKLGGKVKVIHITPSIVWHSIKLREDNTYQFFHIKFIIFWVYVKRIKRKQK